MADAAKVIAELSKGLPRGATGGIVGVATDSGMNAAVVHRVGRSRHFEVATWIGKEWGSKVTGGGAVNVAW